MIDFSESLGQSLIKNVEECHSQIFAGPKRISIQNMADGETKDKLFGEMYSDILRHHLRDTIDGNMYLLLRKFYSTPTGKIVEKEKALWAKEDEYQIKLEEWNTWHFVGPIKPIVKMTFKEEVIDFFKAIFA